MKTGTAPPLGWCAAAWLVLGLAIGAGEARARQVHVVTTDGRDLTGELVEKNDEKIVVRISGIRTTIARDRIEKLEYRKTLVEQFKQQRAKIEDTDLKARYKLARKIFDKSKDSVETSSKLKPMKLALKELDAIADRMGDDAPKELRQSVKLLRRVVESRVKVIKNTLEEQRENKKTQRPGKGKTGKTQGETGTGGEAGKRASASAGEQGGAAARRARHKGLPLDRRLTKSQINLIRVYEIDEKIQTPINIPRKAEKQFLSQYAGERGVPDGRAARRRWMRQDDREKLGAFFEVRARDLYRKVEVQRDPPSMQQFRRVHQQYVLNYCATRGCHGGGPAGDLALFRREPRSDRTVYSNFLILDRYMTDDGKMIDRQRVGRSLLLRYGLRPDQTPTPHPDVEAWQPRLRGSGGRLYQEIADWIRMLYRPAPEYGIDWQPPKKAIGSGKTSSKGSDDGSKKNKRSGDRGGKGGASSAKTGPASGA